jgi:hypothetical protein
MPTLLDSILEGTRSGSPNLRGFWSNLGPSGTGFSNVANNIQPIRGGLSPSASSIGTSPFGQPRGLPIVGVDIEHQLGLDDAQAVKFRPGTNPRLDELRMAENRALSTPLTKETYARYLGGGGNLSYDFAHQQWTTTGGNANTYGTADPARYRQALEYLNRLQTQIVGTPALNQLNALNASRQQQPQWRWGG